MPWFRRRWDESRGDALDAWGAADHYFRTDAGGVVLEQIEIYDDGHVLVYDAGHRQDAFGALADEPLDLGEFASHQIDDATVARAAQGHTPFNR
jgi:hypothetical protein